MQPVEHGGITRYLQNMANNTRTHTDKRYTTNKSDKFIRDAAPGCVTTKQIIQTTVGAFWSHAEIVQENVSGI